jgi:hypothetical protein
MPVQLREKAGLENRQDAISALHRAPPDGEWSWRLCVSGLAFWSPEPCINFPRPSPQMSSFFATKLDIDWRGYMPSYEKKRRAPQRRARRPHVLDGLPQFGLCLWSTLHQGRFKRGENDA